MSTCIYIYIDIYLYMYLSMDTVRMIDVPIGQVCGGPTPL
jgi:hypothetical protein